jgi:hypothetical protein
MGRPKAPSAFYGPVCHIFYPTNKANIILDSLENRFRVHELCDCDHRRHVEAKVEVLLTTVNGDIPVNFRPCDVSKEIQFLKLRKVCYFSGIRNKYLCHLVGHLHLTHLFNHFPASWKEEKIIILSKPGKDPKFPQHLYPTSLLSCTGRLVQKSILRTIQKHIEERQCKSV